MDMVIDNTYMVYKKHLSALGLLALAMSGNNEVKRNSERNYLTSEEKAELKRIAKKKQEEIKLSKGLKPFNINGEIIWALNEKNAKRKGNKK